MRLFIPLLVLMAATMAPAQPQPPHPAERRPPTEAPIPPRGPDRFADMRIIMQRVQVLHQEAEELRHREQHLAEMERRIQERIKAGEIDSKRAERLTRIVNLRRELLPLEQAEYTADTREKAAQALERLREARNDPARPQHERARFLFDRMEERLQAVHDSATDFDTLYQALQDTSLSPGNPMAPGEDARNREIEALRERLQRLEEEAALSRGTRERRRIIREEQAPDQESEFPGANAPPPEVEMNERRGPARRN